MSRSDFCGRGKAPRVGMAKQALILVGRRHGASVTELAKLTGMTISNISRRSEAAAKRSAGDNEFEQIVAKVNEDYLTNAVGGI